MIVGVFSAYCWFRSGHVLTTKTFSATSCPLSRSAAEVVGVAECEYATPVYVVPKSIAITNVELDCN